VALGHWRRSIDGCGLDVLLPQPGPCWSFTTGRTAGLSITASRSPCPGPGQPRSGACQAQHASAWSRSLSARCEGFPQTRLAMALYNLQHIRVFFENMCDTRVLVAWNATTVVVAFRGTVSLANAVADLQVCRTLGSVCPSVRLLW
jgi:hypothetical protein